MQRIIILLAVMSLILPGIASAKLYKCENDKGEIIYTDQPCVGEGKELKLPPFSTYTPNVVPSPKPRDIPENDEAKTYTIFEILTPTNDKIIFSNEGKVVISFKIDGPLLSIQGHKFALELDGKLLKSRGVTNQIQLNSVDPGTHTVQVFVVNSNDTLIKGSNIVTFHMKRQSGNTPSVPGELPTQPGGLPSEGGGESGGEGGTNETTDNKEVDQSKPPLGGGTGTVPGSTGTIPGSSGTIPGG